MIIMSDIKLKGDIISVDCSSTEYSKIPNQFELAFNYKTEKIYTDTNGVHPNDIKWIMYKLTKYLEEGKELPSTDCLQAF